MPSELFFDEIKRRLERMDPDYDNEAMRHDLIIHPLLTSPFGLGWDGNEIIPQKNLRIGPELINSYIWGGAVPKKRRPDLVIVPYGINKSVAIIEEKRKQASIQTLKKYLPQVGEYQQLENVVWGLLSDGEKWILRKNNEIYAEFATIHELQRDISELQSCIGKAQLLARLIKYNTTDIVYLKPSQNLLVVCDTIPVRSPLSFYKFLLYYPATAVNLVEHQQEELLLRYRECDTRLLEPFHEAVSAFTVMSVSKKFLDIATGYIHGALCQEAPNEYWGCDDHIKAIFKEAAHAWAEIYPELYALVTMPPSAYPSSMDARTLFNNPILEGLKNLVAAYPSIYKLSDQCHHGAILRHLIDTGYYGMRW